MKEEHKQMDRFEILQGLEFIKIIKHFIASKLFECKLCGLNNI